MMPTMAVDASSWEESSPPMKARNSSGMCALSLFLLSLPDGWENWDDKQ